MEVRGHHHFPPLPISYNFSHPQPHLHFPPFFIPPHLHLPQSVIVLLLIPSDHQTLHKPFLHCSGTEEAGFPPPPSSSAMASFPPPASLFVIILFAVPFLVESQLSLDYYQKTCPDFAKIVHETVTLELSCPGIVSCSDVLAQATRDLIAITGGPSYNVPLGREDSLVSKSSEVEGNIPKMNQTIDELIKLYTAKGFTIQEMVALYGGRTIGFSNCKEFGDRIFKFSKSTPTDPEIHPKFAEALKKSCEGYEKNPGMSAYSDVVTPGKFDNVYFQNLLKGLGLSASEHAMVKDARTRKFVEMYAGNQALFFKDFSSAMEKLSVREVKTGGKGEVRRKCDVFNSIQT
uniref:Peroxidase n=1 Tax=Cucumis sativus TaxID=3659 RepID=A0A0A0LUC3_CUCSA